MTLPEAVTRFEALFVRDDALPVDIVVDVVSGGVRRKGAPLPLLYADQERAIDDWLDAAETTALSCVCAKFRWIEKPALRQYQMTISDVPATQRATDSRWCVESRIVFAH